jgi:fructose-1,6-bisphosphatase
MCGKPVSSTCKRFRPAFLSSARAAATAFNKPSPSHSVGLAGEQNVQGEDQKKLDVLSDQIMVNALRASGKTAVLVSEELEEAVIIGGGGQGGNDARLKGNYCVVFDPLDGSSNIDAGVNVGTIFGVYKIVRPTSVLVVCNSPRALTTIPPIHLAARPNRRTVLKEPSPTSSVQVPRW